MAHSFGGAFSIGSSKRRSLAFNTLSPGPGAYYNENVKINSPSPPRASIGNSPRKALFDGRDIPPPGSYEINSSIGRGAKITFPKTRPKNTTEKMEIGPGSYDIAKSVVGKPQAPIFTFSSKYQDPKNLEVPGVGSYEVKTLKKSNSVLAQTFGHSNSVLRIRKEDDQQTPGPGEYQIGFEQKKGTTFARSGRMSMRKGDTPGPGHFELLSLSQSQRNFTLGSKIPVKDTFSTYVPGPGAYNVGGKLGKHTIKIGDSQRSGFNQKETPGPGQYGEVMLSKDDSFAHSSPQNRGLSYAKRPDLVRGEITPGPGRYEMPGYVGKSTTVKINTETNTSKWKEKIVKPGPGAYNVSSNLLDSSKGISLGSKHQSVTERSENPGPGAYDSSFILVGPKYTFTQDQRYKQDIRQLFEPSPGQYEIQGTFAIPAYLKKNSG